MKSFKNAFILVLLILVAPVLSACTPNKKDVVISILSSSTQHGTVLGGGTYLEEETATLVANAKPGNEFVAWIKNSKIMSTESTYSFKVAVASAGTYTAVFKSQDVTYIKPFAMAISAVSKKPEQIISIEKASLNFAFGESTQAHNLANIEDLAFGVYDNTQTSSVHDIESDYLLRLRTSFGPQTYTFSASVSYTIGETNKKIDQINKVLSLVNLEEKTDIFETKYYQATLTKSDENITVSIIVWFSPAGFDVLGSDIII